ncbi:MAG: phosphoribosylglycinamide formyltransferase [Magnetococcales bacterium]|nr:phosphoribosylglycinamide formyltransferase [Magnetococcales bacterium]
MTDTPKIAVLISGSGSNLQSLIDNCASGYIPGRIALVISNKPDVFGLERAEKAGIPTRVIKHRDFDSREAFDQAMGDVLEETEVDLVCLAGFMRILTAGFVDRFQGRLINIHPALLPSFPGLDVQQAALDAGVRFSGCTVHFVDEGVDTGPIIAQAAVPILPDDDAKTLAGRILRQEHRTYPLAVRLFVQGRLSIEGRRVHVAEAQSDDSAAMINPPEAPG